MAANAEQELALLRTHPRIVKRTETSIYRHGGTESQSRCVVVDSIQPPDRIRREIINGTRTFVFVSNGDKCWTSASDGVSFEMEAEDVAQFKKSLCGLPEPDDLKPKVLLPGIRAAMGSTLDGQAVVIVEGKKKGGLSYKVFFDANTNLPIRREYEAYTPPNRSKGISSVVEGKEKDGPKYASFGTREKEIHTAVIEYKEIDGLKYAFRTVESVEGKIVLRTEVDVKLVEKFDLDTFQEPVAATVVDPIPIFRVFSPGPPGAPPGLRDDPKYWPPQWRP
jgi:hypothetical protein